MVGVKIFYGHPQRSGVTLTGGQVSKIHRRYTFLALENIQLEYLHDTRGKKDILPTTHTQTHTEFSPLWPRCMLDMAFMSYPS